MPRVGPASILVLGAGSWGTALALLLSHNDHDVRLWGHEPELIEDLRAKRENTVFLPGFPLPEKLRLFSDLQAAAVGVDDILLVVPSHAFREVARKLAAVLRPSVPVSWATKGFEPGQGRLLHEVAFAELGDRPFAVLSGPTFAREVARGLPTAITVAAFSLDQAERFAGYLHNEYLRAYTSNDVIGVEIGGAAKNVLAIAAGIADGLGFGANTRAALITRGLTEITRLGVAMGGQAETFMGLAGLGDLALTCTDDQSRNRRMGLALAAGQTVSEARKTIGQEVEGVQTAREVWFIAQSLGVEMPITEQTYRVLYEGLPPKDAVHALLERRQRRELE